MRFYQWRYILHIYLLFFFQNTVAQKKKSVLIDKNVSTDSIQKIIQKENLLQSILWRRKDKDSLSGINISDSLQVFINQKQYDIRQENLETFLISLNDSLIKKSWIFNLLKPEKIRLKDTILQVYYKVENTSSYCIDSLVLDNSAFPRNVRNYLYKHFKTKKINQANLKALESFVRQNTRFEIIQPPQILFNSGKPLIQISLKQPPVNNIEALLGLAYVSDNKQMQLQGKFNTRLYNTFRQNEKVEIQWQRISGKHLLDLETDWNFLWGKPLGIKTVLYMAREDSLKSFFYNKLQVSYIHNRHIWHLSYIYDQQKYDITQQNTYASVGYIYNNSADNIKIALDLQFDLHRQKWIDFLQVDWQKKIYENFFLLNHINIMYNQAENQMSQTPQIYTFYRKIPELQTSQAWITALKNEFMWKKKHTDWYIIADYIRQYSLNNNGESYVNAGIGLNFVKKSQILTFEVIKTFGNSYLPDYQPVYINIKQKIFF